MDGENGSGNARDLLAAGRSAQQHMDYVSAHHFFSRAQEAARADGDSVTLAEALVDAAANLQEHAPDHVADVLAFRRELSERAIRLLRSHGAPEQILSRALCLRSADASREEAESLLQEALSMSRRVNDTEGIIRALDRLGHRKCVHGDRAAGALLKMEALQLARTLGERSVEAAVLFSVALTHSGSADEQIALYQEAAVKYRALGQMDWVARCLVSCACLACAPEDWERKMTCLKEALNVCRQIGNDTLAQVCCGEIAAMTRGDPYDGE